MPYLFVNNKLCRVWWFMGGGADYRKPYAVFIPLLDESTSLLCPALWLLGESVISRPTHASSPAAYG